MAKLSLIQQFKNTINSIAPVKSIGKIKREGLPHTEPHL